MATQIVILNSDSILLDDEYQIPWADKGKNWVDAWVPNTVHAVIYNNLSGPNEVQNKDASTGMMTGNTSLSATTDAVGSTTVDQMRVGLTGVTAGSAIGSTTVDDITVGLTGIDLASNLGTVGFGALAYKDIDITSTTSYTDITHAA